FLGDVDGSYRDVQLGCRLRGREFLVDGEPVRLPGVFLDAGPQPSDHFLGPAQIVLQALVPGCAQTFQALGGRRLLQALLKVRVAAAHRFQRRGYFPPPIRERVPNDRGQPAAEAGARTVPIVGNGTGHPEQDLLDNVFTVFSPQTVLAAPGVQEGLVAPEELSPGFLPSQRAAQLAQEGETRQGCAAVGCHDCGPLRGARTGNNEPTRGSKISQPSISKERMPLTPDWPIQAFA